MAFENLSNKLQEVFKSLRGKGVLTEADVKAAMREVKIAMLEADVNFKIVKQFINKVSERAVGSEVMTSLTPGQQVIKIVNEELIELMGSTQSKLTFSSKQPTVFMMVGLQGAGKTTTAGKLAGQGDDHSAVPSLHGLFIDLLECSRRGLTGGGQLVALHQPLVKVCLVDGHAVDQLLAAEMDGQRHHAKPLLKALRHIRRRIYNDAYTHIE